MNFLLNPMIFPVFAMNCTECGKTFSTYGNLRKHVQRFHPKVADDVAPAKKQQRTFEFKCSLCPRQYSSEKNFRAHTKRVHHSENVNSIDYKVKCGSCGRETSRSVFEKHVTDEHGLEFNTEHMTFDTYPEFSEWKRNLEEAATLTFVKNRGVKRLANGCERVTFNCDRSGYYISSGKGVRKAKVRGSKKINGFCPAHIKLVKNQENTFTVSYMSTHLCHGAHNNEVFNHCEVSYEDSRLGNSESEDEMRTRSEVLHKRKLELINIVTEHLGTVSTVEELDIIETFFSSIKSNLTPLLSTTVNDNE